MSIEIAPEIGKSSAGTTFANRCRTDWNSAIASNRLRLVMQFDLSNRMTNRSNVNLGSIIGLAVWLCDSGTHTGITVTVASHKIASALLY